MKLQVVTLIIQKIPTLFTDTIYLQGIINQPNNTPILFGMFLPNHSDTLTLAVV